MGKKVHQTVRAADYVGDYAHNRLVIHIDDEQANIEIFTSFYSYNWACTNAVRQPQQSEYFDYPAAGKSLCFVVAFQPTLA